MTRSNQSHKICNNCWDEIGDLQQAPVPVPVPVPNLASARVSMQQNLAVDNANIDDDTSSMVSVHEYKVHPLAQLFKVAVTMGSFVVSTSAASAAANLQSFTLKRARRHSASPEVENEKSTNASAYVTSPIGPILVVDALPTSNPKPSYRQAISTLVTSLKRSSRKVAKTVAERRNAFTTGGGSSVADDPCIVQKATMAVSPANNLPVAVPLDSVNHHDAQPSSHGALHKIFEHASSMPLPRESFIPSKPPVVTVVIETTAMEALKTQGQKDREELQSLNKRVGDLEGTPKQTYVERVALSKQLADATAKITALPLTVTTIARRDDMDSAAYAFAEAVTVPTPSTTTSTDTVRGEGRPTVPLSSAPAKQHPASTHVKTFLNRPLIAHSFPPPPTPVQPTMPPPAPISIIEETKAPFVDVRIPAITPAMSATSPGGASASSAIVLGPSVRGVNSFTNVQSLPTPVQSTTLTAVIPPPPAPSTRPPPIQTSATPVQTSHPDHHVDPPPTRKSPKAKFNPLWQLPPKRGAKHARYIPPRSPSKKLVAQRVFEYSRGASRGRLPGGGRLELENTTVTKPTAVTTKDLTNNATVGAATSTLAFPTPAPVSAVSATLSSQSFQTTHPHPSSMHTPPCSAAHPAAFPIVGDSPSIAAASTVTEGVKAGVRGGARGEVKAGVRGGVCSNTALMDPLPPEPSSEELMQSIRFGITLKQTTIGNGTTKYKATDRATLMPRYASAPTATADFF